MKETLPEIFQGLRDELDFATKTYPEFASAHEGFAILQEEVDELWDLVKLKQSKRDAEDMQKEALQIAAMAIRFAYDVCAKQRGLK